MIEAHLHVLPVRKLNDLVKASGANTGISKSCWQRCRVHFTRNVLSVVTKGSQNMAASIIRAGFAQPHPEHIRTQFAEVTTMLAPSRSKVTVILSDGLLALDVFSRRHWRRI